MPLVNTSHKFGSVTKLLHWTIFVLFITQYFLVYRREYFDDKAPEKLQYILLHKSIGTILLLIALLMLVWRHLGKRPLLPNNMSGLEIFAAKVTHILLYICMLVMPISGITMSMLSGRAVSVFGWYELPMLLEKNKELAKIIYTSHLYTSYAIIGLVALHIFAALYHHYFKKDNVLTRMLPFRN